MTQNNQKQVIVPTLLVMSTAKRLLSRAYALCSGMWSMVRACTGCPSRVKPNAGFRPAVGWAGSELVVDVIVRDCRAMTLTS